MPTGTAAEYDSWRTYRLRGLARWYEEQGLSLGDEYEEWLFAYRGEQARWYAKQIMSGVRPGDKDLAELLEKLAYMADRLSEVTP